MVKYISSMARKRRKIRRIQGLRDLDIGRPNLEVSGETKRGITIVLLFTFAVLSILSLVDLAGTFGVYLDGLLKNLFGITRWLLPLIVLLVGYFLLRPIKHGFKFSNLIGLIIFILGSSAFLHIIFHQEDIIGAAKEGLGGGWAGVILAWPFIKFMGYWASMLVSLALSIIGALLLFESFIVNMIEKRREEAQYEKEEKKEEKKEEEGDTILGRVKDFFAQRKMKRAQDEREQVNDDEENGFTAKNIEVEQAGSDDYDSVEVENDQGEEENDEDKKDQDDLSHGVMQFTQTKINLPIDLLDGKTTTPNGGDLAANKLIIQKTLKNFGIEVEMENAHVGPTVTQYTLKPAEGVKLSRVTSLGDNLALALAAHPIRIEAPIPGKALIGIEVPNQAKAIVPLKEILTSEAFQNRTSNLEIALGKDVMGKPWLYPLDKMPHLLIAGATGSGKSVSINSVILSLIYQNGPGELKFIMVDPKRVELPLYNGIPYLLTPVITDVKKTINALRWSIKEMEKRFDILSASHHRNIASFNKNRSEKMPYIVIVIDELADLMVAAGVEVEAAVVRLSQMSRAVGIHLILATQRPSVDVITGLIKANITSRIAFSVASLVDSRTILDMSGAEKLLGRGDMLYISADISKPKRLQGAYASDEEIKRIITFLKDKAEPEYIDEVVEKQTSAIGDFKSGGVASIEDGDPLLTQAMEEIIRAKKASASLLQRRLRIGYARAARILDLLEAQGIIGPGDGAKPREVLINTLPSDTIKDTVEPDQAGDNEEETEENQVVEDDDENDGEEEDEEETEESEYLDDEEDEKK